MEDAAAVRNSRLSSLDILRVTASLCVLLYHVHTIATPVTGRMPFGGLFQSGSSRGVDIFFVLNGFVIPWAHGRDVGRPGKWAAYMSRRLIRIYPAALIMTTFAIIIYASGFGGLEKASKLEFHNLVLSLLLMAERSTSVLNVAWTLKYVVFFYVLFGISILNCRIGMVAILVWQVGVLLHAYAGFGGSAWDAYFLQPMGLEFGMGMACAILMQRVRGRLPSFAIGCLLIGGAAGFVACKLIESYLLHRDLPAGVEVWVFGMCAASMLVGLGLLDLRGSYRAPRILSVLGVASFSIYLVNYSAIVLATSAMRTVGISFRSNLMAFALAGAAICCGLLFHFFVDQPIQRRLGRLHKRVFSAGDQRLIAARDLISESVGAVAHPTAMPRTQT